ncbi:MAG: hypothetical protein DI527_02005 [Chelatococcus sp.]|nr:MAG: hypothetical protein DI527_02005 [Chelatococcus sp.]
MRFSGAVRAEAEKRHYAMLDEPAMAACLKRNGLRNTRCGSAEARTAWLTAIVDTIIAEPRSIRLVGRTDNFEKTCQAMPLGAAWLQF